MYIPKNLNVEDEKVITDFIGKYAFGLLISPALEATHLPLVFKSAKEGKGLLYGHFAKANSHWKSLAGERGLVVFNGPHSYISPTWYANKPAVPTWNYVAVHCYGKVELLSEEETVKSMDELVEKYEPQLIQNQDVMPLEYKEKLGRAVVGFKVILDNIQAKEKLGQHKKTEDQLGIFTALASSEQPDAKLLADYMKNREVGIGQ